MKRDRQKKSEEGSAVRPARGPSDFSAEKSRTSEDLFLPKRKSLGQHFLHSAHYLRMIVDAAEIKPGERVLEIGPGDGALTKALLAAGAHVFAVEKDRRLIPVLQETFAQEIKEGRLQLLEGDALQFHIWNHLEDGPYKLVANIPYYITGAILEKFLSAQEEPSTMVLLVQKEVAQRIAREKKESILSLSVKAYGEPLYVKTVPAGAFAPSPKVDSAILAVKNISRARFTSSEHEKKFFALVHAGFAHKRKLLAGNLKDTLGDECLHILEAAGIGASARAEDVPLEAWLTLATRA